MILHDSSGERILFGQMREFCKHDEIPEYYHGKRFIVGLPPDEERTDFLIWVIGEMDDHEKNVENKWFEVRRWAIINSKTVQDSS